MYVAQILPLVSSGVTASGGSLFCSYRKVTKRYAKGTPLGTPGLANSLRLEQSEPGAVAFCARYDMVAFFNSKKGLIPCSSAAGRFILEFFCSYFSQCCVT